jgi:hypothetical protein
MQMDALQRIAMANNGFLHVKVVTFQQPAPADGPSDTF